MKLASCHLGLAAISALLFSTAAQAQSPMGFRLGQNDRDKRTAASDAPPEETLMRTAKCVAEDRPEQIRAYLSSLPSSEAERDAFAAFGEKIDKCMPKMDMSSVGNLVGARGTMTMRFEHSAMRGALAEALMREEETDLNPAKLALGDGGMFAAEKFHGLRSPDIGRVFVLGFAGCVMGHNASGLQELFSTEPGGADEKAAIVAMAPSFGGCIMEGQTLKLRAPTLRNQLAEVVYYATFAEAAE